MLIPFKNKNYIKVGERLEAVVNDGDIILVAGADRAPNVALPT
jgi:hypothetical protein